LLLFAAINKLVLTLKPFCSVSNCEQRHSFVLSSYNAYTFTFDRKGK